MTSRTTRPFMIIAVCTALAACSSGGGTGPTTDYLGSAFLPVTSGPNGTVIADPANERNGRIYDSTIGGAAYITGTTDTGAQAASGIMENPNVGAPGASGVVTYATSYRGQSIENVTVSSGGLLRGEEENVSGSMTLTGDFNNGTITGNNNELVIDATTDGSTVTGTATLDGRTGQLAGVVGEDAIVGAFHGTGPDSVFAGGLLGRAN